ncbi:DUF3871 family protein [Saprospiraceae bacterium]|nr:DUF3871 family protein [Saprospiraceae bacterium]
MELQIINNHQYNKTEEVSSPFIEANTLPMTLNEIRSQHLIPVFVKDNQPTISQADFISTATEIVEEISGRPTTHPKIRVSHPIKGRTFEARNKKASELEDREKTIYYERMAFVSEIPSCKEIVHGQELTLSFGGIKAYNQDNLNNYGGNIQRFKFFIGFKVKVCTNLCIWTDGFTGELKVRNLAELTDRIYELINSYQSDAQIKSLKKLGDYELTEKQFAKFLGRARMYNHLPKALKSNIPQLLISDSQVSAMTKAYYTDDHFSRTLDGNINLWNLYNLLTGSLKTSYINTFLDRGVNAHLLTNGLSEALEGRGDYRWFMD